MRPEGRDGARRTLRRWLQQVAPAARRYGSVCTGAFVLAAAGLLDGKRWRRTGASCARLAERFPAVIGRCRGALSSSTARSGPRPASPPASTWRWRWSRPISARAAANLIARHFVLYARRPGYQSQFSPMLLAQPPRPIRWARPSPGRARTWPGSTSTPSPAAPVSRCAPSTAAASPTSTRRPPSLIAKLRLEQARALLTTNGLPQKALAARCGFGNATRMRRAFERELGVTPRAYRVLHAL